MLNDMDTSSKTDITVVCDEENYEGQNSFIKEQVIPMVTIMLPMEDQSPGQISCTLLCGSSEKTV